jgi:DNA adenine methylase
MSDVELAIPGVPHGFFASQYISPLRYPGSKRLLVPIIEALVRANVPPPQLFVEPFCGGATASLRLAGTGAAQQILLADLDPLVAAFWRIAAFDTEWLVDAMHEEPVTVDRWNYWRAADPPAHRDQALKCLFLNRTTFSGILHGWAGPIGGHKQLSSYKIDCRFPKSTLETRIRAVGALADAGHVADAVCGDYEGVLVSVRRRWPHLADGEVVLYLDPPYVKKARTLYGWAFDDQEHARLATVLRFSPYRWVLSYDDHPVIRNHYPHRRGRGGTIRQLTAERSYTAAGGPTRGIGIELIFTNFPKIPPSELYRPVNSAEAAGSADAFPMSQVTVSLDAEAAREARA